MKRVTQSAILGHYWQAPDHIDFIDKSNLQCTQNLIISSLCMSLVAKIVENVIPGDCD